MSMSMKMSTSSRVAIKATAPSMRVAAPIRGRSIVVRAVVDKAKVMEDVRTVISSQLAVDLSKVQPDANFVDLGADSLDTVEIMMALEEKFEITMDEEGAEKIFTVQEAVDMIAIQIANKA